MGAIVKDSHGQCSSSCGLLQPAQRLRKGDSSSSSPTVACATPAQPLQNRGREPLHLSGGLQRASLLHSTRATSATLGISLIYGTSEGGGSFCASPSSRLHLKVGAFTMHIPPMSRFPSTADSHMELLPSTIMLLQKPNATRDSLTS